MRTLFIILLAMTGAVVATAGPVLSKQDRSAQSDRSDHSSPAAGGMLRTMPHGTYECALPGDAGGRAYNVESSQSFRISTASRYENSAGTGTYILRGNKLTFTAGPKNGQRFERVGENQLRKTDVSGKRGDLLCTKLADRRQ